VVEGAKRGEPAVLVTFEEHPAEHIRKAAGFGWDLRALEREGLLEMIYLRPTDLSVDEVLGRINEAVLRIKARRLVVNSISGFEIALTPGSRDDLREGLYRLVASMVTRHVTTVMTTEVPDLIGDLKISRDGISFLADNIVLLRYVEIESELQKAMMVVKMRTSDHAKELRRYQITNHGIKVEQPFTQYNGILSGIPTLRAVVEPHPYTTGLGERDESLMQVLLALRESTVEDLAAGLGDDADAVCQRLERLCDTGYVLKSNRGNQTVYRVALVSTGIKRRSRSNDPNHI
jgi:circadian clock protein KaiC